MRVIIVGCEYTGKSTLLDGLAQWGREQEIYFHLDDHFTIPDPLHLKKEDQEALLALTPTLKERYQRFQMGYHIQVAHRYQDFLFAGFHIEEVIYGPLYYGNQLAEDIRRIETELPSDTILTLLTATQEVIIKRMKEHPHIHTTIKQEDIPLLLKRFEEEFNQSWLKHKIRIDTSALTPEELLDTFLSSVASHLSTEDMLRTIFRRSLGK